MLQENRNGDAMKRLTWLAAVLMVIVGPSCTSGVSQADHDVALQRISELEEELAAATSTAPARALSGTLLLRTSSASGRSVIAGGLSDCRGKDGFDDVHGGVQVVVRDQAGVILGVGVLEPGSRESPTSGCEFPFVVDGVPTGLEFYTVEVGGRGETSFSLSELDESDWSVSLTLN